MSILAEKIQENRFLRLLHGLLEAGYREDWKFNATLSGVPQGGIVSPILTNIYLDKLDKYVERVRQPVYNQREKSGRNQEYMRLAKLAWYHKSKGHTDRSVGRHCLSTTRKSHPQ
jgi:retron-type reverse transcriptase